MAEAQSPPARRDPAARLPPGVDVDGSLVSPASRGKGGAESKQPTANPTLQSLHAQGFYQEFFDDKFDASRYANSIIQGTSIANCLQKLSEGIQQLDGELRAQVIENHHDLLLQATSMEKLEAVLLVITTRVDALHKSSERLRDRLDKPYHKLRTRTQQLARLQAACDILRRTTRFLYLNGRLREQARAGSRELAKVAHTISEIDGLLAEADLTGIDVVDGERARIEELRDSVQRQGAAMLLHGVESSNATGIDTALQVFRNLEQLAPQVEKLYQSRLGLVRAAVDDAFAPAIFEPTLDKAAKTTLTPDFRAMLWTRVDSLFHTLSTILFQVLTVHKRLSKKRDAAQVRFSELTARPDIYVDFVLDAAEVLTTQLQLVAKEQPMLRRGLETDYPKLLRQLADFWNRVVTAAGPDFTEKTQSTLFHSLRSSFTLFETAFIGASLARMFDHVNASFPDGSVSPPAPEEMTSLCKTISRELEAAQLDSDFAISMARNVTKTVNLVSVRCEGMRATERAALVITRGCTEAMARNIALVNCMSQFRTGLHDTIASLPKLAPAAAAAASAALEAIEALLADILDGIFDAAAVQLEATIASMHTESFSGLSNASDPRDEPDQPCSPYVLVLQSQVNNLDNEILARFSSNMEINLRVQRLMQRLMRSFVRHTALLARLTEAVKLRLAADMAQIELAIGQLQRYCSKRISDLGEDYHALRSLRPLLFMDLETLPSNPSLGSSLPWSVVLHHLFSRSPAIKPPHALRGLSPEQYVAWLAEHSERDALAAIGAALDSYLATVKSRGEQQFAPPYAVMRTLLQRALPS